MNKLTERSSGQVLTIRTRSTLPSWPTWSKPWDLKGPPSSSRPSTATRRRTTTTAWWPPWWAYSQRGMRTSTSSSVGSAWVLHRSPGFCMLEIWLRCCVLCVFKGSVCLFALTIRSNTKRCWMLWLASPCHVLLWVRSSPLQVRIHQWCYTFLWSICQLVFSLLQFHVITAPYWRWRFCLMDESFSPCLGFCFVFQLLSHHLWRLKARFPVFSPSERKSDPWNWTFVSDQPE